MGSSDWRRLPWWDKLAVVVVGLFARRPRWHLTRPPGRRPSPIQRETRCVWVREDHEMCGRPTYARVDWYGGKGNNLCREHHHKALSPWRGVVRLDAGGPAL